MPTIFVSDAIDAERMVLDPPPAGPLDGWKALSARYQASFAACGHRMERLLRPEIYQTVQAREVRGIRPGDWHLAVKPAEHLRPLHGVPNVFVCDDAGFANLPGGGPFSDHRRMLGLADAIICGTDGVADTLRQAGLIRVVTLPPCIPAELCATPSVLTSEPDSSGLAAFRLGLAALAALLERG